MKQTQPKFPFGREESVVSGFWPGQGPERVRKTENIVGSGFACHGDLAEATDRKKVRKIAILILSSTSADFR